LTTLAERVKSAHVSPSRRTRIDKKMLQATTRFSYIGLFFGIAVVLGWLGGHWCDRRWHTEPWLGIVGLLLGVAAGFRELYRVSKRAMKDERS
jgi:F0F1-type ATP synthase assembly protein I